jgi:hypothetical protein
MIVFYFILLNAFFVNMLIYWSPTNSEYVRVCMELILVLSFYYNIVMDVILLEDPNNETLRCLQDTTQVHHVSLLQLSTELFWRTFVWETLKGVWGYNAEQLECDGNVVSLITWTEMRRYTLISRYYWGIKHWIIH